MTEFKDNYTTSELKAKDPTEQDKTTISNDAYGIGEMLEKLLSAVKNLTERIGRT